PRPAGLDIAAFRVPGAADEGASAAAPAGQRLATVRAGSKILGRRGPGCACGGPIGLGRRCRRGGGDVATDVRAFRVAGAADEWPAPSLADDQLAAALRAHLTGRLRLGGGLALDVAALRVPRASDELAVPALADDQLALTALRAGLAGAHQDPAHLPLRLGERPGEGAVPRPHRRLVLALALLDAVEP